MRPQNLEDYIGQEHLVGLNGALRTGLEKKYIPSMILWGPPGTGKTTLALLLAKQLDRPFFQLSAISAGVKDVRETIEKAESQRFFSRPNPILFIDEIHRFNKAQQDALLGAVEKGTITLIGATTENPSFEVISALLSRCQVYTLKSLSPQQLISLLENAISQDEHLKQKKIKLLETEAIMRLSGGDARKLLNILELVVATSQNDVEIELRDEKTLQVVQQNIAFYDKNGEQHYDIVSAFIKSMRGSDPNAALYYLACMLEAGEDVKFIARRMVILAAEDIGLANPNALLMANSIFQAVTQVGMPEARIILAQGAVYLASSAKSNSAYMGIENALAEVRKNGVATVPLHLRNAPTKLMKSMDYGKSYQYAHDFEQNFVNMEFLPENLIGTTYYQPSANAAEEAIRSRMKSFWKEKYGY